MCTGKGVSVTASRLLRKVFDRHVFWHTSPHLARLAVLTSRFVCFWVFSHSFETDQPPTKRHIFATGGIFHVITYLHQLDNRVNIRVQRCVYQEEVMPPACVSRMGVASLPLSRCLGTRRLAALSLLMKAREGNPNLEFFVNLNRWISSLLMSGNNVCCVIDQREG